MFTKGAHPSNAISFLIAATNLVIELGLVLLVLLSWHFVVGNFLLGILMIVYAYTLTRLWLPERLAREARSRAEDVEAARPSLREMVAFEVDYTLWLNIAFVGAGLSMLVLRRRTTTRS